MNIFLIFIEINNIWAKYYILCLEWYTYLSQNINRIPTPNGKILVRILSRNPHGARKWVDGDFERSVTQYVANTTKISLGGEYVLSNEQHTFTLSRDIKKIPFKTNVLSSIKTQR